MREAKFRAWDEGNKVMHNNFQFFTSGEEGNDWVCFCSDKEGIFTEDSRGIVFNNPYFRQQIKIMQYTGLRDRNGREIYEGDVVKRKGFVGANGDTGTVVFAEACFRIKWKRQEFSDTLGVHCADSEVIGNIYQDSHLLLEAK